MLSELNVKCPACGHTWLRRVAVPKRCPSCKAVLARNRKPRPKVRKRLSLHKTNEG